MKKVILMSMEDDKIEWSPAKYQLLDSLKARGFVTYVILPDRLKNRSRITAIDYVINAKGMTAWEIRKEIIKINPQIVIATLCGYSDYLSVTLYNEGYIFLLL